MSQIRHIAAVVTFLIASSLSAAEPVTDLIPGEATIVVFVKDAKNLLGRVEKFLPQIKQADERAGDEPQGNISYLKQVLPQPLYDILASSQSICLVALPPSKLPKGQTKEHGGWLFVTQDEERLKKLIQEVDQGNARTELAFLRHAGYLIACDVESLPPFQRVLKDKRSSLTHQLADADRQLFQQGDVAAYCNVGSLITDDLRQAELKGLKSSEEAWKTIHAMSQGGGPLATLQLLSAALLLKSNAAIMQAYFDTEKCLGIIRWDESGIHFEGVTHFKADSVSTRTAKAFPPGSMNAIRQCPGGHQIAVNFHGNASLMFQDMLQHLPNDKAEPSSPLGRWRATLEELSALKFGTIGGSIGIGDMATGMLEIRAAAEVDHPHRLAAWSRRLCETEGDSGFTPETLLIKFKLAAEPERFGKRQVDVATLEVVPKPLRPGEAPKRNKAEAEAELQGTRLGLNMLGGPQGVQFRAVSVNDRCLLTLGGGKLAMADMIRKTENSEVGVSDAVNRTVTKLWPEANLVMLVDVPSFQQRIFAFYEKFAPGFGAMMGVNGVAAVPSAPSYMGLAFRNEPQSLRARLFIPPEQLEGMKSSMQIFQMFAGGAMFGVPLEEQADPVEEKK